MGRCRAVLSNVVMAVANTLIPGLDDIVRDGDPQRHMEAVRKVSDLFLRGASRFRPSHIELFDGVFASLVPKTNTEARSALAEQMANLPNPPPQLVALLVHDDEVSIAGPLLRRS